MTWYLVFAQEDPGESLSDCDKNDEEILDAENFKNEDDTESEDSFVVPDGYLSENEVQMKTQTINNVLYVLLRSLVLHFPNL